MDKNHDYSQVRELVEAWLYRGEEVSQKREIPGYRTQRWVVEWTHPWLNRFRRLLISCENKVENYLAMIHFACARIGFLPAGVFG